MKNKKLIELLEKRISDLAEYIDLRGNNLTKYIDLRVVELVALIKQPEINQDLLHGELKINSERFLQNVDINLVVDADNYDNQTGQFYFLSDYDRVKMEKMEKPELIEVPFKLSVCDHVTFKTEQGYYSNFFEYCKDNIIDQTKIESIFIKIKETK